MHHKAKELPTMIFFAMKDSKTISLLRYMHVFTLTLWCTAIVIGLSLYFFLFVTDNTVSPRVRSTRDVFGFKHRGWSTGSPSNMQGGITIFIKITDLTNNFIPEITLVIATWSFDIIWILSLMFQKQNVTIDYCYIY